MSRYLDLLLRLSIWFLLTADLSLANILIGLSVALLLPRSVTRPSVLKEWIQVMWKIILAIPQAYIEAIEMMIRPHYYEEMVIEQVKPNRTPGLIFLDIFLITFTPKTIVLNYHKDGWYAVHHCTRKKPRPNNSHQNIDSLPQG